MADYIWINYSRPRPHWYEESQESRDALEAKWSEIAAASREKGGEPLGRYHIRGQSDFKSVEIWRFGSAEEAFDHWTRLTGAAFGQWFAFSNNIGLRENAG
ncbi:hypothetical protein SAMN05216548_10251 [Faunimonas pinastri]|uniref:ABM domain-containing protein n=1 Tax=Faunimonas pinastri TaxID=1855383 RepID=A0A1H9C524_9HYPH|nr:hypothetical protein [Faunimonas pinastri]SEP96077.1 hypothetical protein SAMN05216548_10251 [Faunimonas pinastri]